MLIVIPSRGRAGDMRSLRRSTPPDWRARTRLLVPEAEAAAYRAAWPDYEVWPSRATTIAATKRHWDYMLSRSTGL